jgi:hypothetical protein
MMKAIKVIVCAMMMGVSFSAVSSGRVEEYMTDSGEVRESHDGSYMTDSGEIGEFSDEGDYMTDSGEERSALSEDDSSGPSEELGEGEEMSSDFEGAEGSGTGDDE